MYEKEILIDARGHLLGRLASVIAKELLSGQRVVVVRCEQVLISGSLFRNKLNWDEYIRKAINTNPRRGFHHYRQPSRMLWKTVRGMLPHKSPRGAAALARLKVFEGVPYPYDHQKRMVIPQALRVLRMKAYRRFCVLGDLAEMAGWTKKTIVEKLEEKRLAKSKKFHELKEKKQAARTKAMGDKSVASLNKELAKHGF